MQSLGNDFVMLDGVHQDVSVTPAVARRIADRHFGIGCDQILAAERSSGKNNGIRMRIFNSDGSEVGQCGNGARCFARFLHDRGITDQSRIPVETCTTRLELICNEDGSVTVDMGVPEFRPDRIPIQSDSERERYRVDTEMGSFELSALSMGNPHGVLEVDDVNLAPVTELGPRLENHAFFPQRANIGFVELVAADHVRLRVHERGAGETLGCGSGACAAVVSLVRRGKVNKDVTVSLPGGDARVVWHGQSHPVMLTGPVEKVFEGEIDL